MIMESSFNIVFFSIIILGHLMRFSCSVKIRCHDDERSALLHFKDNFVTTPSCFFDYDYSNYPKVDSWKGVDCCSWDGVVCDPQTNHVSTLDLSNSCVYGSINSSSTLFSLVHLQKLDLSHNDFKFSQIPLEIGKLSNLSYLNLSYSSFSGQIPSQLSNITSLVSLDLSDNYSLWLYSPGLKELHLKPLYLKVLHLSYVDMSSSVLDFLVNFSSLESLRLDNCRLNGEFPIDIFNLPNLKILDLSSNSNLSGNLPNFHSLSTLKSLLLTSTNFGGELSPSIGNLAYLEKLDISNCNFTGKLPLSLNNLTQLVSLDLSNNHFNPHSQTTSLSWICNLTKLTNLFLDNINLKSEIPSCLTNLTQLSGLSMSQNQLIGQIPVQINHLTSLSYLDLSSNKLEGPIPTNLFNLHKLVYLQLAWNNFVGLVDLSMLFQLKSLYTLILSYNKFSLRTKIDSSNFKFPYLMILGLASCNLSDFPKFIRNQDALRFLDLSNNNIRGQIPSWIYKIGQNTLDLNLSHNLLTGFEQGLQSSYIRSLDLRYNMLQESLPIPPPDTSSYLVSHNKLSGEVSPLICNLSYLVTLDLSVNNLSGKLPECLGNFGNSLSVLDLKGNNFHGSIPSTWRNGCKLRMISMSHNQLQGQLPRSLANCSLLEFVDFGNNQIIDTFPFWLGTIPELSIMILRSNGMYGELDKFRATGFSNLRVIDLSHNNFKGKLPSKFFDIWNAMKVSNASQMVYMEKSLEPNGVWSSSYYGSFDYSMTIYNKGLEMNYMKIPDIFNAIDFSYNNFQGQIPDTIGNLKGIQLLNLSGNILSGRIPSLLADIKALECLDLSENQLSGSIPMQLTGITSLSSFDVSFNNLSGPIPQVNQFCTFDAKSFEGNARLSVATWTKQCGNLKSKPLPNPSFPKDEASESAFEINWLVVSMGTASGLIVGVVAGNEFTRRKWHWLRKTFGIKQRRPCKRSIRNTH